EQLVGPTVVASTILNPVPAGAAVVAQASPVYKDQRGSISRTLNFQIPAQLITGSVRFTAKIAAPPGTYASPALPATISVDALLNRRLRIAFIPVGYNGPAEVGAATTITRAAPTLANLLISLADSLAMYPVTAAPDIRALPPHTRTEVLMDVPPAAGGCRTNVGDLKGDVDAIVAAAGTRNDAVYVALYANGIPSLSGFGGCGGGNTMVTETGFGIVFAHELGHALGRGHAPCGNVGGADPNYPAYEPYDTVMAKQAVIGEYGLDIRDGMLHRPKPSAPNDPNDLQEHD